MTSTSDPTMPSVEALVNAGLPADRDARLAARKAFVDMKQLFLRAVQHLRGAKGDWLREKVRLSEDPMDLWLLRGALLSALQGAQDQHSRDIRGELYRSIDSTFPAVFQRGELGPSASGVPIWIEQAGLHVEPGVNFHR